MKHLYRWLPKISVMLTSLIITSFMFLSSFELVSNRDLKFIPTISQFKSSSFIDQALAVTPQTINPQIANRYHKPTKLRIKATSTNLDLVPAINQHSSWYKRQGKGHYLVLNESSYSKVGDVVIYLTKSWRTLADSSPISQGTQVFLETNTYQNMYKVVEINTSTSQSAIINQVDKPFLTLIIEDPNTKTIETIKAIFVSHLPKG